MDEKEKQAPALQAETESLQALKEQYHIFTDRVLLKWMDAVTGSHREAILSILRDRGHSL